MGLISHKQFPCHRGAAAGAGGRRAPRARALRSQARRRFSLASLCRGPCSGAAVLLLCCERLRPRPVTPRAGRREAAQCSSCARTTVSIAAPTIPARDPARPGSWCSIVARHSVHVCRAHGLDRC